MVSLLPYIREIFLCCAEAAALDLEVGQGSSALMSPVTGANITPMTPRSVGQCSVAAEKRCEEMHPVS